MRARKNNYWNMMEKSLSKIFLYLWLVGSLSIFVMHFFFPDLASELSFWNKSMGWQREIALWNMGIMFAIFYSLFKDNLEIIKFTVMILIFISAILGTNHVLALLINKKLMLINVLGIILNYGIMIFGIYIKLRK